MASFLDDAIDLLNRLGRFVDFIIGVHMTFIRLDLTHR